MVTDFDLKISDTIERIILAHGDKQKDLADEFGIPYTTFNSYVKGSAKVPAHVVAQVAEKYDLSTDQIIFADGSNATKDQKINDGDTQYMLESLAAFLVMSNFRFEHISPGTKDKPNQLFCSGVYSFCEREDESDYIPSFLTLSCPEGGGPYSGCFDEWFIILTTLSGITDTFGVSNADKFKFMKKAIEGLMSPDNDAGLPIYKHYDGTRFTDRTREECLKELSENIAAYRRSVLEDE